MRISCPAAHAPNHHSSLAALVIRFSIQENLQFHHAFPHSVGSKPRTLCMCDKPVTKQCMCFARVRLVILDHLYSGSTTFQIVPFVLCICFLFLFRHSSFAHSMPERQDMGILLIILHIL